MSRGQHLTINVTRAKWKYLWRMVRMAPKTARAEFDKEFASVQASYGELTMVCMCYHSRTRRPDPLYMRLDAYSLNKMFKQLATEIEAATPQPQKQG